MVSKNDIEQLKHKICAERIVLFKAYDDMKEAYEAKQLDKAAVLSTMVYSIKCVIDEMNEQLKEIECESP